MLTIVPINRPTLNVVKHNKCTVKCNVQIKCNGTTIAYGVLDIPYESAYYADVTRTLLDRFTEGEDQGDAAEG